jgi:hypothetical protein
LVLSTKATEARFIGYQGRKMLVVSSLAPEIEAEEFTVRKSKNSYFPIIRGVVSRLNRFAITTNGKTSGNKKYRVAGTTNQ